MIEKRSLDSLWSLEMTKKEREARKSSPTSNVIPSEVEESSAYDRE